MPLLNYRETSQMLGVPIGTVYAWVSKKKIPHHRFGRRLVRFDFQHRRRVGFGVFAQQQTAVGLVRLALLRIRTNADRTMVRAACAVVQCGFKQEIARGPRRGMILQTDDVALLILMTNPYAQHLYVRTRFLRR